MALHGIGQIARKIYSRLFPASEVEQLRQWGAVVGDDVAIINSLDKIDRGHAFLLTIGDHVTITNARILTHDASTKRELGYTRVGRVTIGSHVFIGADAILLPGVTIGDHVVIGAGCVVARDVEPDSVMAGNPARKVSTYAAYVEKNRQRLEQGPVYDTYWQQKTDAERAQMKADLSETRVGFDL